MMIRWQKRIKTRKECMEKKKFFPYTLVLKVIYDSIHLTSKKFLLLS